MNKRLNETKKGKYGRNTEMNTVNMSKMNTSGEDNFGNTHRSGRESSVKRTGGGFVGISTPRGGS